MKQNKINKRNTAVSPVIGVILLLVITVILAGSVAAFAFGMSEDMHKTHIVKITVQKLGKITSEHCHCSCCAMGAAGIMITNAGGKDVSLLKDNTDAFTVQIDGEIIPPGSMPLENFVGSNGIYEAKKDRQHIVVTAHFIDGIDQIAIDTWI